ncbi:MULTISPECIES: LacI family DNA-binding transcriptional regulator [unclassified Roseitalea]|uniref:LacI family DNA-binding transcriptional regulator n=1 Tax=unclassified Roseitalea TaxID=2639107 RepID=UPI00273D3044|nr:MULTISPECIES: LacI family DNA-binding transcriptional regulator [unclassified Roseitalea]
MARQRHTVTISQVAEAAGVARSSVSRAFTRPHLLRPDTVERIKAAAARLGYVPNHSARALSTGLYGNLAMIVPDVANPFFPPMIRAAQDAADDLDFCVLLGNSNEDPANEDRLVGKFVAQTEGLILASSRLPRKRILDHAQRRPIVLINRDVEGIPRVLIDSASGVAQAVAHLAERGHRTIAYVSGPASSWSDKSRRAAAEKAAARLGVTLITLPARIPSFEAGRDVTDVLIGTEASAAIAFDDLTAHGIMEGMMAHDRAIPGDFAIVGCDDVLANLTRPPLTSISSRSQEAGQLAVSLLCELLRSRSVKDARIVLDTQLVVRQTS